MNMKKAFAVAIIISMCLSTLIFPVSAAAKTDIVRDDLVVWYDASNNSNGLQDYETTVWKDLTGNGNHMTVKLDETNYWTDNAFHAENNPTYFPDAVVDVVNGDAYTVEMVLGEVDFTATHWITLMCSDNDEFSLFVRQENDVLEYKYNDDNRDRPEVADGGNLIKNSTLSITFALTDPEAPLCTVYVNGVALDTGVPTVANIADTLMWGHDSPARAWGGDVYGFRFYDRALSAEEVAKNASADERNYRSGNYFEPEIEYDGSSEVIGGEDGITYVNNIVTLSEATNLVGTIGEYGCDNMHYLHLYGEHQGLKIMATTNDDGTITGNPFFYVNYPKFIRRAGLEQLSADDVKYIVVKIKVQGEIEDLLFWGISGENATRGGIDSCLPDNYPECTGETEYMLFNMEDLWSGHINNFAFEIVNPAADAVVYIEEIAMFTDEASAYTYAGQNAETERETTDAPTTEAPTADPSDETSAPEDLEESTAVGAGNDTVANTETTEEEQGGCGAVLSGAGVFSILGLTVLLLRKKRESYGI